MNRGVSEKRAIALALASGLNEGKSLTREDVSDKSLVLRLVDNYYKSQDFLNNIANFNEMSNEEYNEVIEHIFKTYSNLVMRRLEEVMQPVETNYSLDYNLLKMILVEVLERGDWGEVKESLGIIKNKTVKDSSWEKLRESVEIKEAEMVASLRYLSYGQISSLRGIKDEMGLADDFFTAEEFILPSQVEFLKKLNVYDKPNLEIMRGLFPYSEDFLQSEEVRLSAIKGMIFCLKKGNNVGALEIKNSFSLFLEEEIRKIATKPSHENKKLLEYFGVVLSEEQRKNISKELGVEVEALLYNGYAKYNKVSPGEERTNLVQEFTQKIMVAIDSDQDRKTFNKLVSIIKELDNQRGNDAQSTADFLFEISNGISGQLDNRQFLVLVRKLSEIKDQKANFFALRLAGQSRVKPLAFSVAMQKLIKNNFIPKATANFISENKEGKKHPDQEKIAILQRIISEYPNQFSTIISTLSDSRFKDFDLVKNQEIVFEGLKDLKAITPIIFNRYCQADEAGRRELTTKISEMKPKLFKNQPIGDILKEQDREILTEMVYLAYNPVGMDFQQVEKLLKQIKDKTQDLAEYEFPEDGYSFSLDAQTSYRVKRGEKINPEVLERISQVFSKNYPKEEIEIKNVSSLIANLAKGGTDLRDEDMSVLLSLLSQESQIKEFKSRINKGQNIRSFLGEANENLGVYFNDNFSRALERFLAENPQSKEKLEAIFSRSERANFIKRKIEKQAREKNLQIDWSNPAQIISACFSLSSLRKLRQKISEEIKKYEITTEDDGEKIVSTSEKHSAYISKNVGSFFAKASAGICTAKNIPLFNRKDHFHINIVENNETVQANIQAYIINYPKGERSLLIRGINPNTKFMKEISVPVFCDKVIETAKRFQDDNGLSGVYLSEQSGDWHALSNREEVASYLSKRYLKTGTNFSFNITDTKSIGRMYVV